MTHLMKTRHYFIRNDKADELSDDDVVFVYQCCFLGKKKYSSSVEKTVYSNPCSKGLTESSEVIPNSYPILIVLSWY